MQLPEGGGRFETQVRIQRRRRDDGHERVHRLRRTEIDQRARGFDAHVGHFGAVGEQGHQRRDAACFLDGAQAARGKCPREHSVTLKQRQQNRTGSRIADPAECVGDGPPPRHRPPAVGQHRRQLIEAAQAHERIHPEPDRFDRRGLRVDQVVGGDGVDYAALDVRGHHRGYRVGGRLVADEAQPFGRAPLNHRILDRSARR